MKQYLIVGLLSAALLGSAGVAMATDATTTSITGATTTVATTTLPVPVLYTLPPVIQKGEMILEVGSRGRVLIRGNVESIGADYVMVKSWGGTWKIKISSGTEVLPRVLGVNDHLAWAVGDYVGAQGTISTTEGWTIDAKVIRDRTEHFAVQQDRKDNREAIKDIKGGHNESARTSEGKIDAVNGTSFVFNRDGFVATVVTSSSTKIVDRNWTTLAFTSMQVGDKLRVYGAMASSTITAEVIRDMSVPR